ncbi:hypothetical protein MKZ38_007005 [Zalerion maritima]|uniref:Non-reducing end beta-L-arabinofuranosidase-like GH127 catalytic domain-containing protein n=1 Tax=Zalerion maritima TaxID=339359 RepID=A0AAD5WN57_9PEZI|nr:hypothetical protein MKZ38_007005 [Zalerion maritima]
MKIYQLAPFKYSALPLGSITASGWLQDQLKLCGDGLGGHMFDFYPYVRDSTWTGGHREYSNLHESAPYWFNCIVPLAFVLKDDRLKKQAKEFLDYVLDHQQEDGWLGAETTRQSRGVWARSPLLWGMMQYAEAEPAEAERIVDAMHKFVVLLHRMLKDNFTGLLEDKEKGDHFDGYGFGVARGHEFCVVLMWLYEHYPRQNESVIWNTMKLIFEGTREGNKDWTKFFVKGRFPEGDTSDEHPVGGGFEHGVNLAQGLQYPTVLYRMTRDDELVQQTYDAVEMTMEYQMSVFGSITGDEYLRGRNPQTGSELCMTVELMFSMAYLYQFHGANHFADIAELAAFNGYPAAMSTDWWAHQYVTQTNQPWAKRLEGNPFYNVSPYGVAFGLAPNYPCCTVNHVQGYPKFVASSYVKNGEDGLAHMLLAPTKVSTEIRGKRVSVECATRYPFDELLDYKIESEIDFDFAVRIPQWATSDAFVVAEEQSELVPIVPTADGLHHFAVSPGSSNVSVQLKMKVRILEQKQHGTVSIYYGSLLYSARIPWKVTRLDPGSQRDRDERCHEDELTPLAEWKYAIDPETAEVVETDEGHVSAYDDDKTSRSIFGLEGNYPKLRVDAYPIEWPEDKGTASRPPSADALVLGPKTRIDLIPFGAAKLHIADFPRVKVIEDDA